MTFSRMPGANSAVRIGFNCALPQSIVMLRIVIHRLAVVLDAAKLQLRAMQALAPGAADQWKLTIRAPPCRLRWKKNSNGHVPDWTRIAA